MARQIEIGQIGGYMSGQVQNLVRATTLEWEKRVIEKSPVGDTGNLRNGWEHEIDGFTGEITNRMKYAEPVCYGVNLPDSWKGQYRTRQNTIPGFPELIGKELESWAQGEYRRIISRS